jgi:hypothetical protein
VPPAEVIASYHNFEETPADIMDIANQALASGAPIAKVATQVNRWEDNRRLFELLSRRNPQPLIVAGMGDIGQITRIVGLLEEVSSVMPRQRPMDVRQRRGSSRFGKCSILQVPSHPQSTKLLGILGMPSAILFHRSFTTVRSRK